MDAFTLMAIPRKIDLTKCKIDGSDSILNEIIVQTLLSGGGTLEYPLSTDFFTAIDTKKPTCFILSVGTAQTLNWATTVIFNNGVIFGAAFDGAVIFNGTPTKYTITICRSLTAQDEMVIDVSVG